MKNIYKNIKDTIGNATAVVKNAIDDKSQAISESLRRLGKKATPEWVHRQGLDSLTTAKSNFYQTFLIWFAAIFFANRAGAEYLLADFEMFVRQLRGLTNDTNKAFPALKGKTVSVLTEIRANLNFLEGELLGAAA